MCSSSDVLERGNEKPAQPGSSVVLVLRSAGACAASQVVCIAESRRAFAKQVLENAGDDLDLERRARLERYAGARTTSEMSDSPRLTAEE